MTTNEHNPLRISYGDPQPVPDTVIGDRFQRLKMELQGVVVPDDLAQVPGINRDSSFAPVAATDGTIAEPSDPPLIFGDHFPEVGPRGPHGISFYAALASAIYTVKLLYPRGEVYDKLLHFNHFPPNLADSPRNIDHTVASVRRFPYPLASEQIEIAPLIDDDSLSAEKEQKKSPIARVFEALEDGAAVIVPLRQGLENSEKTSGRNSRGRMLWGTVTGYWGKEVLPDAPEADQVINTSVQKQKVGEYTLAVAYETSCVRATMVEAELIAQLGNGRAAQIVRSVPDYNEHPPLTD